MEGFRPPEERDISVAHEDRNRSNVDGLRKVGEWTFSLDMSYGERSVARFERAERLALMRRKNSGMSCWWRVLVFETWRVIA